MPQLLCTVRSCHTPLRRETHRVVCGNAHSFDVARSGYINLLQPQDRRASTPGDSVEAVAARRRFVDRGFARPLLDGIREIVSGESILDAGCGEGYYLGSIGRGCGVDISVAAIDLAARRYPQCEWIVANADRFIPYAGGSFDAIISITGRMNPREFQRLLKPDGMLLIAIAAPDDLVELRGTPNRDRVQRTIDDFAPQFELVNQSRIATRAELDQSAARDIMTATYRPRDVPPAVVTLSLDALRFRRARTSS